MTASGAPDWTTAAIPAAVRLAAEAGTEVDEALEHLRPGGLPADSVADRVGRLERSADLTEVATDLAALLWSECGDVPRIATILDEPAAQAALEAVAEARRVAAGRLADGVASHPPVASVTSGPSSRPAPVPGAAAPRPARPEGPGSELPIASPARLVGHQPPLRPTSVGGLGLRSAAGAVAAGTAAAALVAVGRRLRRT